MSHANTVPKICQRSGSGCLGNGNQIVAQSTWNLTGRIGASKPGRSRLYEQHRARHPKSRSHDHIPCRKRYGHFGCGNFCRGKTLRGCSQSIACRKLGHEKEIASCDRRHDGRGNRPERSIVGLGRCATDLQAVERLLADGGYVGKPFPKPSMNCSVPRFKLPNAPNCTPLPSCLSAGWSSAHSPGWRNAAVCGSTASLSSTPACSSSTCVARSTSAIARPFHELQTRCHRWVLDP